MLTTRTKKKMAIAFVSILALYVIAFGFLSYHEFQEWTFYPFIESMISVFMAAGAIAVITGIILVFQAMIQSDQEKQQALFGRKIMLYENIIQDLCRCFDDGEIDEKEKNLLFFRQLDVALLSGPSTFRSFSELVEQIADEEGAISAKAAQLLMNFVNAARDDLDVQKEMTDSDKENLSFALELAEKAAEAATTGKRDTTKYNFMGKDHGKGRLVQAVITDYVSDHPNVSFQELTNLFPAKLQGKSSRGIFCPIEDAEAIQLKTGYKRHFLSEKDYIRLADCSIVVSSQWGRDNIGPFVRHAREMGFEIS